ncbi:MAG: pitrilysin family protein [Candidatus Liptonbacteria bacterium]|nr:pitrilysin family protein [Candidatus Liptonbacteria bacterium]
MVKKIKLPNGLRVLFVPQKAGLTSTVLVLVEAGSEYETKDINGLSHFLEHMCFKGTAKRPEFGAIAQELDALGAEYNAFTGQEYTGYWAKVEKRKFPDILELISDLYLNPIFNPEEIEKERGVVTEELNMYEDTPMRKVQDLFNELLHGDQPAGWDVGGRKEVIQRLLREDFIKYRNKHYVASKTIVIISGNFNRKLATRRIKEYFGGLPKAVKAKKIKTKLGQRHARTLAKFKESEQGHLVIGVPAFNVFDDRRVVLSVLANVLGGGMSSRLFRKVRDELGAAYYIRAETESALDHGNLAVSAGVAHPKTEEVIKAIIAEFKRLRDEPVPKKELQKAKDHLTAGLVLGLETSDQLASFYGGQEVLKGSFVSPEEFVRKVQAVTAEEIRKVAKLIFKKEKLNLAVIGPYRDEAKLKKLLSI